MAELLDEVDIALAAFRLDDEWRVEELARDLEGDVEVLAEALRRFPGDAGAVALVGLDEDAFVILRVRGERVQALVSDVAAADEWDLADSVLELLGVSVPDDLDADDDAPAVPAGDLDLLLDLGLRGEELAELLDDDDAFSDELLSDVARACGFGEQFDEMYDDVMGLDPA